MAPFRRGTRGRNGYLRNERGSATSRGRGRGRGQGNSIRAIGQKSAFYSTRVEDTHEDISESDQASVENFINTNATQSDTSEEDADLAVATIVKPYNTLLQSLGENAQRKQPPLKKRKLYLEEETDVSSPLSTAISIAQHEEVNDLDFAEEPEDAGNISSDDIDKADTFGPEFDDRKSALVIN